MALHTLGKGETQVQFLLGAPNLADVAQEVEQRIENPCVSGSTPLIGTILKHIN